MGLACGCALCGVPSCVCVCVCVCIACRCHAWFCPKQTGRFVFGRSFSLQFIRRFGLLLNPLHCIALHVTSLRSILHSLTDHNAALPFLSLYSNQTEVAKIDEQMTNQRIQITRSLLFVLPCISWSLPKWDTDPWLSERFANSLLLSEAALSVFQSIRSYRIANPSSG